MTWGGAKYLSFVTLVQSCLTPKLSRENRDGDDFCMRSCFRHSVLAGGEAVGAAAALLPDRGPAVVLRLLLPGEFPVSQPLCYPHLDSVFHSIGLYTGILPRFTN